MEEEEGAEEQDEAGAEHQGVRQHGVLADKRAHNVQMGAHAQSGGGKLQKTAL